MLNADPALQGILAQLREAIGDTFTGAAPDLNQLSLVGLSTDVSPTGAALTSFQLASHVPARHFGQGDALFPVMNTREPSGMPMVAVPVGASNVPYAVV